MDECDHQSSVCAPGKCVNTAGSYKCACSQGFTSQVNTPACPGNMQYALWTSEWLGSCVLNAIKETTLACFPVYFSRSTLAYVHTYIDH